MLPGKTPLQALAETPAARLIAQCEHANRAAQVIATTLRDAGIAAGDPIACHFKEHVLLIIARSAAQAGKLRQATPRFLAALRERGWNVSEIRIRVQPTRLTEAKESSGDKSAGGARFPDLRASQSEAAQEFAEKLALTLRPSALRDAAIRLAQALKPLR